MRRETWIPWLIAAGLAIWIGWQSWKIEALERSVERLGSSGPPPDATGRLANVAAKEPAAASPDSTATLAPTDPEPAPQTVQPNRQAETRPIEPEDPAPQRPYPEILPGPPPGAPEGLRRDPAPGTVQPRKAPPPSTTARQPRPSPPLGPPDVFEELLNDPWIRRHLNEEGIDPLAEMREMQRAMDRLLDESWDRMHREEEADPFFPDLSHPSGAEIEETPDHYIVRWKMADPAADVEVVAEESGELVVRTDAARGRRAERRIRLPGPVDPDSVTSRVDRSRGVLVVQLRKSGL